MTSTDPSPQTWTLRLKYHKTTVLLHADSLQSLDNLKEELLSTLRETCPSGKLHGIPLPESHKSIQLAKPVDLFDISKGWKALELDGPEVEKTQSARLKDSLKGSGVKDHGVLAFRFGKSGGEGQDSGDEDVDVADNDAEWDVVVPSYEDAYGVQNEGDVGGLNEFTG